MTTPDCIGGWIITNPDWPSGTKPYRERCSGCDTCEPPTFDIGLSDRCASGHLVYRDWCQDCDEFHRYGAPSLSEATDPELLAELERRGFDTRGLDRW
jgi:hypothetical protein